MLNALRAVASRGGCLVWLVGGIVRWVSHLTILMWWLRETPRNWRRTLPQSWADRGSLCRMTSELIGWPETVAIWMWRPCGVAAWRRTLLSVTSPSMPWPFLWRVVLRLIPLGGWNICGGICW